MTSARVLLKQPDIRRLFLAQTISSLGTWIGLVALNVKIYEQTQSSLGIAGLFLFLTLPSLLLGPLGGLIVDRADRRRLLIVADCLRFLLTIGLVVSHTVAWLYLLIFAKASASVLYRVARLAIVPEIARQEDLLSTNALLNSASMVTLVLGPAVGGLLVAAIGAPMALVLDALSFGLSALCIWTLHTKTNPSPAQQTTGGWQQLQAGLAAIGKNRRLLAVVLTNGVLLLGTGAINALEIVYAQSVLHVGDIGYGLLLSAWGGGLLVGTLGVGWLGRRWPEERLFVGGIALLGVSLVLYAHAPGLLVALLIGIVGGSSNGVVLNLSQMMVQTLTPKSLLGRVAGVFTSIRDAALFLSMLAAGFLADAVGVPAIFSGAGVIVMGAAVFHLVLIGKRWAGAQGDVNLSPAALD